VASGIAALFMLQLGQVALATGAGTGGCARSSRLQAQKRQVLACPVLYGSGAPDTIRTCDLCLYRRQAL